MNKWISSVLLSIFIPSPFVAAQPIIQQKIALCENARKYVLVGKDDTLFLRASLEGNRVFPIYTDSADLLDRFSKEFDKSGLKLIIALLPSEVILNESKFDFSGIDKEVYSKEVFINHYTDALKFIRSANINVVDVLSYIYKNKYIDKANLMAKREDHFSESAGKIFAMAISLNIKALAQFNVIPQVKFKTIISPPIKVESGLVNYVKLLCPGIVVPDEYSAYSFTEQVDADLLDDTQPSIIYVGTSYSSETDESGRRANIVGHLREILGADIYNNSIPGGGPYGSITQYLLSDEHKSLPGKILIWELSDKHVNALTNSQEMRQLLPTVNSGCINKANLLSIASIAAKSITDTLNYSNPQKNSYIHIKFLTTGIVKTDIRLEYSDGSSEYSTLEHVTQRLTPQDYFYDLQPGKTLKSLTYTTDTLSASTLEICNYGP